MAVESRTTKAMLLLCAAALWTGQAQAQNTMPPNAGRNPVVASPVAGTQARLNATGRAISLEVPLSEYGPLGQVHMTLMPDDQVLVSAQDLVNALSRELKSDELARLKALADTAGMVSAKALSGQGYTLVYDPQSSALNITTPLSARAAGVIGLGYGNSFNTVQPDLSAPLGVFLNYRVGETLQITGSRRGELDFNGDFELSGRIAQTLAFENFATMDQRSAPLLSRTASRLIYDIPGPALRLSLGDLNTETTAFQADPQIAGFNVSHLINTFYPYAALSGLSSRTLVLTRASDVQLMVNNAPITIVHLNPGTYDVRDLPLTQGANRVQAVITDSTGNRVTQNFNLFSDPTLLNTGLDEYTFSAGTLAPIGSHASPVYSGAWAMSGFYRRGITDWFTGGANLQAQNVAQVVGLDGVFGTPVGLFQVNLAANHAQSGRAGGAARVEYSFTDDATTAYFARTFNLSAEYDSPRFGGVSDGDPVNTQSYLFSAEVTQPLIQGLYAQLGANYAVSRLRGANTGSASAYLVYQAPYDSTIGLGATYIWAPPPIPGSPVLTGRGLGFALTLTHRFDDRTVASTQATRFQQRGNISHSPSGPIDDYYYNGDISHSYRNGISADATAGYETTRGNINGTYNSHFSENGSVETQQAGAFWDGSIALAAGHVGLGQHISDGFAVISGDPSLGDHAVVVQSRFANQAVAESGALGPALVGMASYQRQIIPYDVKDLPPGYDLGAGNFDVYPWFHAGFALKVGSPYNVTILGYLLDELGKPLSLIGGEAVSLDDKAAPHQQIITNREGRFAGQGLSPGRWRISMNAEKLYVYDVVISPEQGMLARFDSLKPTSAK